MKTRCFLAILAIVLACACGQNGLPQAGGIPEITDTYVDNVSDDGALLCAKVSDSGLVGLCGFHVYQKGSSQAMRYETSCENNSFSVMADGLRPDTVYEFEAFIENGKGLIIKSERHLFTTLEGTPGEPSYSMSFEEFVLREFDTNHDGTLSEEEALKVRKMTVHTDSIASLTHLERFRNLETLICHPHRISSKSLMRELDLSGNPALKDVNAIRNDMEDIIFPENSELVNLNIGFNNFITLDLRPLHKLKELNLTGCHKLQTVYLWSWQNVNIASNSSFNIIRKDE